MKPWTAMWILVACMIAGAKDWVPAASPRDDEAAAQELHDLLVGRAAAQQPETIARWILQHNQKFVIEVGGEGGSLFRYSHPLIETLHHVSFSVRWADALAGLTPEERFSLFRGQQGTGSTRRPADLVPRLDLLTEDLLQYSVDYLIRHAASARYDAVERRILYADNTLREAVEYIWAFARGKPGAFDAYVEGIRGTPRHHALLVDSFVEDPGSRVEPFDHLSLALRDRVIAWLRGVGIEPCVSQTPLGRLCRQAAEDAFGITPSRFRQPRLVIGHDGDPQTRSFEYFCLVPRRGTGPVGLRAGGDALEKRVFHAIPETRIAYGQFALRPGVDKQDAELRFDSGGSTYTSRFEVESGQGNLPQPEEIRLTDAEELGVLNAVISFSLVPALSDRKINEGLLALAAFGYRREEGPVPVGNLISEFLKEAAEPHTGFLAPIYHVINQELYRLGWQDARKVVLVKDLEPSEETPRLRRIRVVVFIPPAVASTDEVVLDRVAFRSVFQQRFAGPGASDTLTIMNMACDSQYTVESWMAAFREAAVDAGSDRIESGDVPFILGARRGFDADRPLEFLVYPITVLEMLAQGKDRAEILEHLQSRSRRSYQPASNYGRENLFQLGGNFRVRVVNADDPREWATY